MVSTLKLPVLKTGEYYLWSMRMEQYLTFTNHALWEVIVNGDSISLVASASAGAEAIPDEHLLKFHACKDAKSLWEAIKYRFGGNKESKKMQKTILKQNYENFAASRGYKSEVVENSSSNSQNVAFVSSDNSSSTNETVDTAHNVFAASSKDQASTASYADDIDSDDLEEMDLKWQVAMLTIRVKRCLKKECTDTSTTNALVVQDGIGGYDWSFQAEEGLTNFALIAFTSQGSSSLDSEVHTCSKDCLKSYEALQKQYDQQCEALNKSNLEIIGYQMGLESLEARIVIHEKNEALEEALKEKDDLKLKLENFEESLKNLTKLINSQISAKEKTGLGYDSQINESELNNIHKNESKVIHSVFNSKESDVDDNLVNDRFKTGEGFHAVLPPYIGNYMPPSPDLSFAGLDESVFKSEVKKTTTSVPKTKTSISKTSKDIIEKPKTVRPSAPIIEEWDTDNDNDSVFRPKSDQTKPKFTKINFVKSGENVKSVNKENTHRQVEYPRKSQSPRGNRRNWNGMMTQKLGNGFEFIKKACFVCGSFNHLIKDCDFHDNKMVEKPVLNNKGRVTGQREIRPVWNNAQRVNHQNKLTHPHPKRNFVPTAVATKSGQVPVNAAKQSSPRAAVSISTVRPVNIVAPKPKVNDALPTTCSYFQAHSPVRKPINKITAVTDINFNKEINTAKVNNVTTVGPKAVVSAAKGNGENAGNPQYTLKDQGIFDSECSRHMTGNKSFLTDYQEIGGGFVAFGGSPKGGKITGKGKIRTGKLDFEDTECLVLSPNFKLLDESQVLLKVPRQNNMYSFDLKNQAKHIEYMVLECFTFEVLIDGKPINLICSQELNGGHELDDRIERAATTASSLEAEQDSVDFLNSTHINYALTENPTIYVSLIHQFWQTVSASTFENEEMEITTTIDGRVKTVTESIYKEASQLDKAASVGVDVRTLRGSTYSSLSKLRCRDRVEKEDLEDPSKQGRSMIEEIDQDTGITLAVHSMPVSTSLGTVKEVNKEKGKGIIPESDLNKPIQSDSKDKKEAGSEAAEDCKNNLMKKRDKGFSKRSHTLQQLKRLSFDELKALFETTMRRVETFHPIESEGDKIVHELTTGSSKRDAEVELDHEGSKKQKTNEALGSVQEQPEEEEEETKLSQDNLQQMMMVVPVEEVYVEALQVKYPIIDWEIYSKDTRRYWRIIRVGNHTEAYQSFDDMLKKFDRDDLDKL
ncbi:hypothetical protein Tco_0649857 [Tanacetum coccineum]